MTHTGRLPSRNTKTHATSELKEPSGNTTCHTLQGHYRSQQTTQVTGNFSAVWERGKTEYRERYTRDSPLQSWVQGRAKMQAQHPDRMERKLELTPLYRLTWGIRDRIITLRVIRIKQGQMGNACLRLPRPPVWRPMHSETVRRACGCMRYIPARSSRKAAGVPPSTATGSERC